MISVSRRRIAARTFSSRRNKSQNASADMLAISVSLTDTMSVERGSPSIAANSPKISPAVRSQKRTSRPLAE
jgi:hypothetical protein